MPVIASHKIVELARAENPKQALIEAGDWSKIEIFGQNLLVATYIRPEKTKGGIIRPESNVKEDEFQGNVGLVVKVGGAFTLEEAEEWLGSWVLFGYNDGLKFRYYDVPVRVISCDRIRAAIENPGKVL